MSDISPDGCPPKQASREHRRSRHDVQAPIPANEPPRQPTEEELELKREMESFVEPEEALGPHGEIKE